MKILKPGKLPSAKTITTTCDHCGCKFRFAIKEAKLIPDQRDGDFYQVHCPQKGCGSDVNLDASLVSK